MSKSFNISELSKVIRESFPEIPFAHIFGSAANGVVKSKSDIDIAIWYSGNDPFIKIKVLESIEPIVYNTQVDVVNIYNTNPILAHEALAGNLLFIREEHKTNYALFYSRVAAEYEDKMFWVKKQLEYRGYEVQWNHRGKD